MNSFIPFLPIATVLTQGTLYKNHRSGLPHSRQNPPPALRCFCKIHIWPHLPLDQGPARALWSPWNKLRTHSMIFKALHSLTPAFPFSLISRHSTSSTPHTSAHPDSSMPPNASMSIRHQAVAPDCSAFSAFGFLINFDSSFEMLNKHGCLHVGPFFPPLWISLEVSGLLRPSHA